MIPGKHRFHGHNSLRHTYQRGSSSRGPMISLKFARQGGQRPYRAAVVVSRKVSKSALRRNRIRRRVYELVRQLGVAIPPGMDLVFTVFDEKVADLEAAKLQATITGLIQKATKQAR